MTWATATPVARETRFMAGASWPVLRCTGDNVAALINSRASSGVDVSFNFLGRDAAVVDGDFVDLADESPARRIRVNLTYQDLNVCRQWDRIVDFGG